MRISIIAAMDEKRGIGKDNHLLFHIPEDFQRMKQLTSGHPIIMGRKTFESKEINKKPLPNRINIVVTSDKNYQVAGATICNSLQEAVEQAKVSPGSDEVFIFGGGQIYQEALDKGYVDKLYLTVVEGDFGADTFFPDYSNFTKVVAEESRESEGHKYKFLELEKI